MTYTKNLGLKHQPAPSNITNLEQMSNNQIKKSEVASDISIVPVSHYKNYKTFTLLDSERFYVEKKSEREVAFSNVRQFLNECLEIKPLSSSISFIQTETEQSEAKLVKKKVWKGSVSLDSGKYNNKPQKDEVGHINNGIANGATKVGELQLIKAITSGQSWSPTIFKGGLRKREGFVAMSALVADFDDGFKSLDEILKRAKQHNLEFSFVHESFSHTPERPKYRGVILLEQPIEDCQTAKLYCEYIKHIFKDFVDKGAAEPTRLYYGGRKDSVVLHNKGHQYSLNWLESKTEHFKQEYSKLPKPNKSKSTKKVTKSFNNLFDSSKSPKAKSAKNPEPLKEIDYQIDYDAFSEEDINCLQKIITCLEIVSAENCDAESSWFEITAALKFEANSHSNIKAEIETIWDKWSSKSVNHYNADENYSRWASLVDTSSNAITLGTVISKFCGGWDNVQQQMQKLFPQSKSKKLDPYYVSPLIGTFQVSLAKVLEAQDYISLGGKCYSWTGTHWKMIDDDAMMTHVARESQKFYRLTKEGEKLYSYGTEKDVIGGLNFFKSLHNRSDINMNNTHLIAFDNGTLDVRTGTLSPNHNKSDNLTFKIAGDYIKDVELPEVAQSFFASAFGEELIPYIRAVIQMYLNPNFPYGKFVHVIGASGSGKGTFIRLLLSMFDSISIGSGNDLTCFNKPDKVMQELSGKSIYAFPDVSGFTSNCTGFYELVDNGILSGRNLFSSHSIAKRWSVRFIVGSVNPLKVGGSSDGWERRVLQLPTKRRQGKIDPYLGQKLEDVSAQIASWAIQMPKEEAFELIQNASENKIIRQSTLAASMYGDTVKQFLDQCVVLTGRSDNFVPISKLHEQYKMYCQKKGYKAVAQNSFSSTVQSDLVHLYQKRTTVKGKRRPASIYFIKFAPGLFTEAQGMNLAQYNLEHESEGNFENLLNFDPSKVSSDPNQAQIETAIVFCDEDSLKDVKGNRGIGIMKFKKMLGDINESELNQEQKELLAKYRK